ncbi:hypothetical protein GCM10010293_16020 [Streptomyces griseoflavus]|nr:hypothetical protein GCM10010293_16020 [Streptomyces griseoflavus]
MGAGVTRAGTPVPKRQTGAGLDSYHQLTGRSGGGNKVDPTLIALAGAGRTVVVPAMATDGWEGTSTFFRVYQLISER